MTRRRHELTDAQHTILAEARKRYDLRLTQPEQMEARMWMTHLAHLAQRGLIIRGRTPIISLAGLTALSMRDIRHGHHSSA